MSHVFPPPRKVGSGGGRIFRILFFSRVFPFSLCDKPSWKEGRRSRKWRSPLPPLSLFPPSKGGRAAFALQHCNYALSLSLPSSREGGVDRGRTHAHPLVKNKKGTTLEFEFHFNGEHSLSRSTVWEKGVFLHPLDFQLSLSSWFPATDGRRW